MKKLTKKQSKLSYKKKRYKIQEVIKPNQVILVQVLKDERGLKGAALNNIYFYCWKIYSANAKYSKRWWYIKKNF